MVNFRPYDAVLHVSAPILQKFLRGEYLSVLGQDCIFAVSGSSILRDVVWVYDATISAGPLWAGTESGRVLVLGGLCDLVRAVYDDRVCDCGAGGEAGGCAECEVR